MTSTIHHGDAATVLRTLPEQSVQCCITSPPYFGLRDYKAEGQLGLEPMPEQYVERLVGVFREVRRVLRDDGTLWLNLGDSYAASRTLQRPAVDWILKPKDLVGIPWMVAFALRSDGWYLRSDIIWNKPNPMPESVTDRPTKAHEYLFLLSKSARYVYDAAAIAEPVTWGGESASTAEVHHAPHNPPHRGLRPKRSGNKSRHCHDGTRGRSDHLGASIPWEVTTRNRRTVWTIATQPFPGAHFAVMPPALVEPCVLAGSREGDAVLDPFAGSGTVGVVCRKHRRDFVGIELNADYCRMAEGRLGADTSADTPLFGGDAA